MQVTACDVEEGLGQASSSVVWNCRAATYPQLTANHSCVVAAESLNTQTPTHTLNKRNKSVIVEKIPQAAKDRYRRQFPTGCCDTPFSCSMDGEKSAAPKHWSQANRREHPKSPQFRATSTSTLPERSASLVPTSRKVLRRRISHVIRRRWV